VSNKTAQEVDAIVKIHGFVEADVWKGWEDRTQKGDFRTQPDDNKADFPEYVDSTLPPQSELEMDLLMRMLEYNATKRISLQVVLENQYIKTHGDQIIPENIPPMPLAEMYQ
jgi:hypothetical protein